MAETIHLERIDPNLSGFCHVSPRPVFLSGPRVLGDERPESCTALFGWRWNPGRGRNVAGEAAQNLDQRRLASAVRPHQNDDLTSEQLQVDALERLVGAEAFG